MMVKDNLHHVLRGRTSSWKHSSHCKFAEVSPQEFIISLKKTAMVKTFGLYEYKVKLTFYHRFVSR